MKMVKQKGARVKGSATAHMAHPLDRLDLLLDASECPVDVRVATLAQLAEYAGMAARLLGTAPRLVLDIPGLGEDHDSVGGDNHVVDPIITGAGELLEISIDPGAWEIGGEMLRFERRFKDALRTAGMETRYSHAVATALQEVASNAQEHSCVATPPMVTYEVRDGWWSFSVTDRGVGIPGRLRQNPRFAALKDTDALAAVRHGGASTFRHPRSRLRHQPRLSSARRPAGDHAISVRACPSDLGRRGARRIRPRHRGHPVPTRNSCRSARTGR